MPKSRRDRLVPTTATAKKTRVQKEDLIQNITTLIEKHSTILAFEVQNYRNLYFKEIRAEFKNLGRFFYGSNRVMQKALGSDESSSINSSHLLSPYLVGNTGLLVTSVGIEELQEFLGSYVKRDYLRYGGQSPETVVVGKGPLVRDGLPLPNNMEPLLRKLGLPTALESGVLVCTRDYTICKANSTLDASQASLLKLLGHDLAEFRVILKAMVKENELSVF